MNMLNLAETSKTLTVAYLIDGTSYDDPEELAKRLLEAIQRRAIVKWGERRWLLELTRTYCQIYQAKGDEKATIDNRRKQIQRVFEQWGCTLETAIALALCVGCRIQLACTEITIETI